MTMITSGARAYAMAKYFQHRDSMTDLLDRAWHIAIEISMEQKWPYPKDLRGREIYRHLARVAVARHIDPDLWQECRTCKGQGKECRVCRGKGRILFSTAEIAELLGVNIGEFEKTWAPRIDHVADQLQVWDSTAKKYMREIAQ
jgi:hypothetical protein